MVRRSRGSRALCADRPPGRRAPLGPRARRGESCGKEGEGGTPGTPGTPRAPRRPGRQNSAPLPPPPDVTSTLGRGAGTGRAHAQRARAGRSTLTPGSSGFLRETRRDEELGSPPGLCSFSHRGHPGPCYPAKSRDHLLRPSVSGLRGSCLGETRALGPYLSCLRAGPEFCFC